MKPSTFLLWIAALAMSPFAAVDATHAQGKTDQPLAAYRGRHRVLLVFALSDQDPAYRRQTKLWAGEKAGFADRQLVVLPVLAEGKPATSDAPGALAKRFGTDGKSFAVVLIGKDGHDAYRSARPVTADTLYSRIDAMPMRRDEMQRQKEAR